MLKTRELFTRVSQRLDLPPEAVGQESQILLSGNHQVTVDGHHGIRLYDPRRIEVRCKKGCVCIDGDGLQVSFLSSTRLCIRGRIDALTLEGAG